MNSRHAASLALVGWYLMLPPRTAVAQATRESGSARTLPKDEMDRIKAEAVIAHNDWLLKIPHVTEVQPTFNFDEHDNYNGPAIAVFVDKDRNISEVQRKIPSKLDGLPVVVIPERPWPSAVDLSTN
jgi:hypothetical protein